MTTSYIRPCYTLQPYIHTFAYTNVGEAENQLLLDQHPTGHTSLAWFVENTSLDSIAISRQIHCKPRFTFTGQLKKYTPFFSGPYTAVYAVFRPLGAMYFFHPPQHAFTDCITEIADLVPDSNVIYQQLSESGNQPQRVVAAMEQWLLERMAERGKLKSSKLLASLPRLNAIVKKMITQKGRMPIDYICRHFNIPQRTLESQFRNCIGLSPKTFNRMLRINQAQRHCHSQPKADWQEIVHEYDFFDQAHFIKEFKSFFGRTPGSSATRNLNLSAQLMGIQE